MMDPYISHDRKEETPEAKARWFQSLSMSQRMDLLCSYTDLILSLNPRIVDRKNAEQSRKGIQIISLP